MAEAETTSATTTGATTEAASIQQKKYQEERWWWWWRRRRNAIARSSPKSRSVLSMAVASAMHFAGYEYARTGTLTLITSERAGFSSASIVPLAMGFVSPVSLLLLWVSLTYIYIYMILSAVL